MKKIIEVEIGFPKSIVQYEGEPFKHKVEVLSKEEILANRSNAYEFIDFDKQETLEELKKWREEALIAHEINQKVIAKHERAEWKLQQLYSEEEVRKITLDFFYHWWNSKGTNTEQGFDKWFEKFKNK